MNQELFRELTPPPGGLRRLLRRLDDTSQKDIRRFTWLPNTALVTVAIALALLTTRPSEPTLENVLAESSDLLVFKYGYKPLPDRQVQLIAMENAKAIPVGGGFEILRDAD